MGPDDGWRYHDPHQWGHGMYHHGPPPWVDGPDPGWSILPGLFPLLLVLWIIYRFYALDQIKASARRFAAQRDTAGLAGARTRWDDAVARHAETAGAYAAFECDPRAALDRPALADVTEPATARFVDAFAEATATATDAYPGPRGAARSGTAAVDAAERVRAARFAPGERALIDQALALLALAQSSPHEAERRSAYERARRRLADLERRTGWVLPRAAGELVATRARGMLDAA